MPGLLNGCLDPVADDSRLDGLDFHPDLAVPGVRGNGDEIETPEGTKPARSFWSAPLGARELIERQGVKPLQRIEDLRADFWPDDESIDDFIAAVRRLRGKDG